MNRDAPPADPVPWWAWLLVPRPRRTRRNLRALAAIGRIERVPTLWQVLLGIMYMRYRLVFRSETIGVTERAEVRSTRRARWLSSRPVRFPFLLRERCIAPFELTGFSLTPDFLVRHVLGAYHADDDAMYDLELLAAHPEHLQELRDRVAAVVQGSDPRAEWRKDLCIYEGYHQNLLEIVEQALAGEFSVRNEDAVSSDATLRGFVAWCCAQPDSPRATWRALRQGELSLRPTTESAGA